MSDDQEVKPLIDSKKRNEKDELLNGYNIVPLRERANLLERLDVGPFLLLYLGLILFEMSEFGSNNNHNKLLEIVKMVAFPLALVSHLIVVIFQQWNIAFACRVGYYFSPKPTKSRDTIMKNWTHCLVTAPSVNQTAADAGIVPVRHIDNNNDNDVVVAVIVFHDVVFRACSSGNDTDMNNLWKIDNKKLNANDRTFADETFHRLRYPDNLSLSFYKAWKGHDTLKSVRTSHQVYGNNHTRIQLPPFMELLGQQLLAPFFLFQLFCVVLWSLDEYWYYALFVLGALLMFESTVAYNRLKGLERLRGTLKHAYYISVYRCAMWMTIRTDELVPGDVISLVSFGSSSNTGDAQDANKSVPADLLLLEGSVVVDEALLTGESVPQLKGPIDVGGGGSGDKTDFLTHLDMQDSQHKQSILFGGTMLVSHDAGTNENNSNEGGNRLTPPDGGVLCMVLKTGFETTQGSLLRTMAHSSMKSADGIHTEDTFVFVAMLLVCAVLSAISVLQEGWNDETRNRFRLVLHVILIVTSVVPPELPMELSLAVTNSVADLMRRCRVYCTEPFRIPWAGQVDTCCFDKTGTLTSDEMQLRGVRLQCNSNDSGALSKVNELPWETLRVMASCHSLAVTTKLQPPSRRKANQPQEIFKEMIGDPLEKAMLQAVGYSLRNSNILVSNTDDDVSKPKGIIVHHRFAFSSRLKRMSVLLTESNSKIVWGVVKGAPEAIRAMLKSVPDNYDEAFSYHMRLGQRVLAMAYRNFGKADPTDLKNKGRDHVERDLIFAGFLVLECPLKPDSKQVIKEIRQSGHEAVMITGDAVLTATEVARQVGIMNKKSPTYELKEKEQCDQDDNTLQRFHFVPLNHDGDVIEMNANCFDRLTQMVKEGKACFCATGVTFANLAQTAVHQAGIDNNDADSENGSAGKVNDGILLHPAAQAVLKQVVPIISVFARHSPRQKEAVVAAYNLAGRHTLMCGDGTNDVGALKRAHVGISIISAPELEAKHREAHETLQKREKKSKKKSSKRKRQDGGMLEALRQMQEAQQELEQVELGDASVASPFTSRALSIKCCKDVLQQGRCTLVTMLTIYKILGVNCLVNALVLTKLFSQGVKQGDRQITILGIIVAAMFLFVTRGKPVPTLSPARPPSSVLCASALVSIATQFMIHCFFITVASTVSLTFVDPYDPGIIPDASFTPNVLNSFTFLLTMAATINTFVVNYQGQPFMEDLKENFFLLRSAMGSFAILFVCALEIFPPLNDLFQLAPFPSTMMDDALGSDDAWIQQLSAAGGLTGLVRQVGFPVTVSAFILADTGLTILCERIIRKVFSQQIVDK